jgi:predicted secreted protein
MAYSSSPTLTGLPPYYDLISLSLSLSPTSRPPIAQQETHRRDQDAVARLDRALDALAVLVGGSGPDGENARLAQLLDRALGQEDSRRRLDVRFDALHQDAV